MGDKGKKDRDKRNKQKSAHDANKVKKQQDKNQAAAPGQEKNN